MENMMKTFSWVKKLGQWHLQHPGESNTLCGRPMLGNNYASRIPTEDREPCPDCFAIYDATEEGEHYHD